MTEKRFTLSKDTEWWFVNDNTIQTNEFGYREDLTGEDAYRGLQQTLTEKETVEIMNELYEENQQLKDEVYNELDDSLTVLQELYKNSNLKDGKKLNGLYNHLKSLRDKMVD